MRRKTVMKVKKFLAGIDEPEQKIGEIARKIEEYIFKADSALSKRYCRIAFLVLSALKVRHGLTQDKKETYQEIIAKLEGKKYE